MQSVGAKKRRSGSLPGVSVSGAYLDEFTGNCITWQTLIDVKESAGGRDSKERETASGWDARPCRRQLLGRALGQQSFQKAEAEGEHV